MNIINNQILLSVINTKIEKEQKKKDKIDMTLEIYFDNNIENDSFKDTPIIHDYNRQVS